MSEAPLDSPLETPPLGRRYEVGGQRLLLHRSGSGGPTVVVLPGANLVGLDYLNLHHRTAELTTSVLYDRAGTGWSDWIELPRTAAEVADELRELLHVAGLPGPYLLVGHSLGGAHARRFAQRFPLEVAGLLLLDPFHEDLTTGAPQEVLDRLAELKDLELPEATEEQVQRSREVLREHFASWPEAVREPLIEHHLSAWRTGLLESRNLYDVVADELRDGPALPDVPMIVISALGPDANQSQMWSEEVVRLTNERKQRLHAELAASVSHGEHRVVTDAGHGWLHEERQDAVLRAIEDLLSR
ncbi:pimeloyl-ACP methyl ester carboxylesterase [Kitasatospora sp. GAS204A]|uniref:alpha/beta fold hydrolase n=1 Tax=unclassified Kitasatospora TaxID=2633591 RepID=UPI002473BA77|nr:alpha/beta hydrolase [Kitasatospora sp. GAS204B]MDH6122178.1 pimeloyl-ACP methyl ester carboxylesterase [Kitasatospora sp. GAS204B]